MNELFVSTDLLLIATLFIFFVFLAAAIVFLVTRERRRDATLERFSQSAYDLSLKRAQRRAHEIVWRAMQEARKIFVNAELQGVKAVAHGKVDRKHIEEKYEKALTDMSEMIRDRLLKDSTLAEEGIEKMVQAFSSTLEGHLTHSMKRLDETLREHDNRVAKTLEELETTSVERVNEAITATLASSRTAIQAYEKSRITAIDERVAETVSRTAEIVLGVALPAKEHTRLIYRALEEARKEGFFKEER